MTVTKKHESLSDTQKQELFDLENLSKFVQQKSRISKTWLSCYSSYCQVLSEEIITL